MFPEGSTSTVASLSPTGFRQNHSPDQKTVEDPFHDPYVLTAFIGARTPGTFPDSLRLRFVFRRKKPKSPWVIGTTG